MNRPALIKQADVRKAIRAAQLCGLAVVSVNIKPNGEICIATAPPESIKSAPPKVRPIL